jgi:hypothetical protein
MTFATSRDRRAGWPLGLIGMLALVVLTERYIGRRDIDLGTLLTIEWRRTGKAATKEAPKAEILCFGTSLTRLGVSPVILKERTGLSAYALALSGGQPFASYTMLKHALDAGAKPKAVVVDFKWGAISMDPKGAERIFPEIATFGECLAMARELGDSEFLARLALVSCLPSYRCRPEIRANIAAAFQGIEPERNQTWLTMVRNMKVNRGAHHAPRREFDIVFGPQSIDLFPPDWKVHPVAEVYIEKFLSLAESRGIPVFWLLPPVTPAAQARLEGVGIDERYTRYIKGKAAQHPSVTVIDARRSSYAKDAFYDVTHLNRFGTANLTEDLADAINARLNRPDPARVAWVNLPPYRGGTGGNRLEDFIGSHEAVAAQFKDKDKVRR